MWRFVEASQRRLAVLVDYDSIGAIGSTFAGVGIEGLGGGVGEDPGEVDGTDLSGDFIVTKLPSHTTCSSDNKYFAPRLHFPLCGGG